MDLPHEKSPFPRREPHSASAGGSPQDGAYGSGGADASRSEEVVERVRKGAHETIDHMADRATPAMQRLHERYSDTQDMVHRGAEHARDMAGQWSDGMRSTVREHPLTSVAAAVGVGMLLARLTR